MNEKRSWPTPEDLVLAQLVDLKENYKELHKELEGLRIDMALQKQTERNRGKQKFYAFLGGLLPAIGVAIYHLLG